MQTALLHEIYGNVLNTFIALIVVLITCLSVNFIVARKKENIKQKRKFRIRSFYVACFIFIFLMARIWVEGFTHLLAVLGLVSAALVITNKETIMNFVGWLIINWRNLFAEDDLIQIQDYKGYVKAFGVLYFTLSEVSEGVNGNITGRVIRIPNGLVVSHVLVNFSQTSHLLEQIFTIIITHDSDVRHAISFLTELVDCVISEYYQDKKEFSVDYLKKHNRHLSTQIHLGAKVSIKPRLTSPGGIELITRYYCFWKDAEKLQQRIWLSLLDAIKHEQQLKLTHES